MRCPACGFENPPAMRFCGLCAMPFAHAAVAREERKIVTVLFADVVGSTRLSGTIDPERLRAQMVRFFGIAREEIHRYGGTVEKFIGDAVMAVFGLPVVHEDDPERAVRAAAAVRARADAEIERGALPEIRIGIATGEVVADPQAAARGECLVTGEAVNLAARLQQHAEPGRILIGERTAAALRGIARLQRVPRLVVEGMAAPVSAWALLQVGPGRKRTTPAGLFVGRAEELARLHEHIARMRDAGRGHVVTILGEAGIGKSRLMQEFCAHVRGVRVLVGHAPAYGAGAPFWAVGEAIKEECGILIGDPLELVRSKLHDAVARADVADAASALAVVLGLGAERHEATREALFSGMYAFFRSLARRRPLLLILEDVHVAEAATLDFIEYAADRVGEVPCLLLVLARPELLEWRPAWMNGKQAAATLSLDPLQVEASRAMIRGILAGSIPEPLLRSVLDHAAGNPLFIEEMLRTLVERQILVASDKGWVLTVPVSQASIPDTVHAVIAARLDALPPGEKRILQTAAVVGTDFWLGAVRFITGENHAEETLRTLVAKDILVHKPRSGLHGDEQYTFRHVLIREVAYAMLPKSRRWPQHARCAEWQQWAAGDRQAEFADLIAHHWLQVIALRRDLGLPSDAGARDQATANLRLAGSRAARLYANTTALDHYTRALRLEPRPTVRLEALIGRGEVRMLLGAYAEAREDFAAAYALARETGHRRHEATALDCLGYSYRQQDQIAQAVECLEPALTLSRAAGDPSLTGRILNHIGFTYFNAGRHAEAVEAHQEARRLLEDCEDLAGLAESLHGLGDNALFLARFEESVQWCARSATVSDRIGNRSLAGENRYMIAGSREILGDYAQAQSDAEWSVAALTDIGDVWNLSFALHVGARVALCLGQVGKALEYARRGAQIARQIKAPRQTAVNLQTVGEVLREAEDPGGAWQVDREAVELAGSGEVGPFWMPRLVSSLVLDAVALGRMDEAWVRIEDLCRTLANGPRRLDYVEQATHAKGRVLLALGKAADAGRAAQTVLDMIAGTGALHWRAPAMLLLADAMLARGDPADAALSYGAAAEEAERRKRIPALWRALAGLAEAQWMLGRADVSFASARRAQEIIDRLATTMPDERLRATFLRSAGARRVATRAGA